MQERRGFAGDVAGGVARLWEGVFLGFVVDEDGMQDFGGGGEEVGGDEAGAAEDGRLDVVEAASDVGADHPEGEGLDGDVVHLGDIAEGDVGGAELVDEGVGGVGVWGEERGVHARKLEGGGGDVKWECAHRRKDARRSG